MKDTDPMPFGKYKGEDMSEVPAKYLDWLHGQDWISQWPDVLEYIEMNREQITKELEEE